MTDYLNRMERAAAAKQALRILADVIPAALRRATDPYNTADTCLPGLGAGIATIQRCALVRS